MNEPDISVFENGDSVWITAVGELTLHNTMDLKSSLFRAAEGSLNVVLDLRKAIYIDSAVLQYLAVTYQKVEAGRHIRVLVKKGTQPEYTLVVAGFDNLVELVVEPAPQEESKR